MRIEITSQDNQILANLFRNIQIQEGANITVPGGGTLQYLGKKDRIGITPGLPEIFAFSLSFAGGVVTSLVANWLYEKLKNVSSMLKVVYTDSNCEKKELKITVEDIERAIVEIHKN